MTDGVSFRARLLAGSILWTMGLLTVVSVGLVAFLATHPQPHRIVLSWFLAVPAALMAAVGLACLAGGAIQIRRGLAAMGRLQAGVERLRHDPGARLTGDYPAEIHPLVTALNDLLAERAARVTQAVARAGDLAHGLKTPLAVLARDAESAASAGDAGLAASMHAQIDRMRRLIDYQLAHARAVAVGPLADVHSPVAVAVDGLVRALERLHAGRALAFDREVPGGAAVRCPREDLEEILGNLLDNACKWAGSRVRVSGGTGGTCTWIDVEDDGPGLDPAMQSAVLRRGVRADERVPGFGLGLAIARDLAEAYGGSIELSRSTLGGLLARVRLPAPGRAPAAGSRGPE